MTNLRPAITTILRAFFDDRAVGTTGIARERILTTESRLREFLETEGERGLASSDRAILAAERQITPAGAFCRLMHADDLVYVLALFVEGDRLERGLIDRRVQLRLVDQLASWMLARGMVDREEVLCPLLELRGRISRARADLRAQVDRARRGMSPMLPS